MHPRLRETHRALASEYDTATSDLTALLDTLRDDVLPQLALELALPDQDIAWLDEWLSDVASVFCLLRRHKFIRPFALQEIQRISIWRLRVLRPLLLLPVTALFHCLPPPIADPFGRPLVFLKVASLQSLTGSVKDALLQEVERLRLHLRYIRDHCSKSTGPFPLQYLVLVDLDGVSFQNYNLDVFSWFLSDIIPRYPGMLAAVFLLNCSWVHSGAWSVAKRLLPSSTIARVFFPSKAQLLTYCSAATLPAEYGGSLPTLDQIDDALRSPYQTHHLPPPPPRPDLERSPLPAPALAKRAPSTIALSPFSPWNPYYGYPAIVSASSPHTFQPARRGLRELVCTLAILWWRRWRRWVLVWTCVSACAVVVYRMRRAREVIRVMVDVLRRKGGHLVGSSLQSTMQSQGKP